MASGLLKISIHSVFKQYSNVSSVAFVSINDENLLALVDSPHDAELAKEAERCIMMALDHSRAPTSALSPQALRAVADLLGLLGRQQPVMLMPQKRELSTQEVAGFLNVSLPFVIKQIEAGKLAHLR
jgi:hypothetical protein